MGPPPHPAPLEAQVSGFARVRDIVSTGPVQDRRNVVQSTVWSHVVVVLPPGIQRSLSVSKIYEPVL